MKIFKKETAVEFSIYVRIDGLEIRRGYLKPWTVFSFSEIQNNVR